MKKKVLMSLILLAIIGTSAVFAQAPTLDKLRFTRNSNPVYYSVNAVNNRINGAVVIPTTYEGINVSQIGINAFDGNTGITSVSIPNSVTVIQNNAFRGCTGLTSITIPASVEIIYQNAFQNCTGLTSINIPSSVHSINSSAFAGCTNLTSVTFNGTSYRNTTTNSFPGDLVAKHQAGGAGTYTRQAGSNTWTKQAGQIPCPHCGGTGFISR